MKKHKPAGVCIFCERTGVTKQHVFPDWLRHIIPRTGNSHDHFLITGIPNYRTNVFVVAPERRTSRGPLFARKIRNVCKTCNSGWMSQLEVAAKDCLAKMILDEPIVLSEQEQSQVSAWVAMTCTMAEFTDSRSAAIPADQRIFLMEGLLPPAGWSIFLGRSTAEDFTYSHTGSAMMVEGSKPPSSATTQTSTFRVGALLVHAVSSSLFDTSTLPEKFPNHLTKIWPLGRSPVKWPPTITVGEQELASLNGSHFEYFKGLQV